MMKPGFSGALLISPLAASLLTFLVACASPGWPAGYVKVSLKFHT